MNQPHLTRSKLAKWSKAIELKKWIISWFKKGFRRKKWISKIDVH